MQDKHKPYVLGVLWFFILIFSYLLFSSINSEIKFDQIKNDRYQLVIKNLKDIRDSQLAHRNVKGIFQNNWDSLVKFVEVDSFTITQRRDSSVLDKEMTKRYGGVKTYKDIVIVDTLGFVPVKDSLFGDNESYKMMAKVPIEGTDSEFSIKADIIDKNGYQVPVFEVKVKKDVVLFDQNKDLLDQENKVISVDGVNGPEIILGSMSDVSTSGNWPTIFDAKNKD